MRWAWKAGVGCVMAAGFLAAGTGRAQSLGEALRLRGTAVVNLDGGGDAGAVSPAASADDALHQIAARADVIFTGDVTAVERSDAAVTVRFLVRDGIRGAASGATFVLREWPGLWADDPARYVVGEQRLMLLHASSVCGYASPVAGAAGSIRLRGNEVSGVADLRWLIAENTVLPSKLEVRAMVQGAADDSAPEADPARVDRAVLEDMLHTWQRESAK